MSYFVGDTAPGRSGTLTDGTTGLPANLAGATVEIHIRKPDRTVLTRAATVTDAAAGRWSYSWAVGELDQAGVWTIEAQATFSGNRVQTFGPLNWTVRPAIA